MQWDTSTFPLTGNLAVYLYEEPGGGVLHQSTCITLVAMYRPTKLLTLTQDTKRVDCGNVTDITRVDVYRFNELRVSAYELDGNLVIDGQPS